MPFVAIWMIVRLSLIQLGRRNLCVNLWAEAHGQRLLYPIHAIEPQARGPGTKSHEPRTKDQPPTFPPSVLPALNWRWIVLLGSCSANQSTCASQSQPKYGILRLILGRGFGMVNSNLKRVTQPCLGPAHSLQRCGARTRRGTACQKPPLNGKTRCRLHGGLSTGPRTAEGKARIAAAQWKHGRRSRAFTEARKQIWADLRAVEARMRADGLI